MCAEAAYGRPFFIAGYISHPNTETPTTARSRRNSVSSTAGFQDIHASRVSFGVARHSHNLEGAKRFAEPSRPAPRASSLATRGDYRRGARPHV